MPKVQQGRGVGHGFNAQVYASESAHRLAVIKSVFKSFVGQ
jgi:hypothetical protein